MVDSCYDYQEVLLAFVNGRRDHMEHAISALREFKEAFQATFCNDVDFLLACLAHLKDSSGPNPKH